MWIVESCFKMLSAERVREQRSALPNIVRRRSKTTGENKRKTKSRMNMWYWRSFFLKKNLFRFCCMYVCGEEGESNLRWKIEGEKTAVGQIL